MIVLDEQLLGRNIEEEIRKWYQGTVQFITELRPHSVIKDDAIPQLLRQQNEPTFVTINESDFWKNVETSQHYCIICFALPDSRTKQIPQSLRSLFRRPEFMTKAKRMGTVIRMTNTEIHHYSFDHKQVTTIALDDH